MKRRTRKSAIRAAVALAVVAFCVLNPRAQGCGLYVPPAVVEALPDMPSQRGIVVWRDGIEQLIVESDLDGEGKELAWIIPVPAEPTSIAPASAGLFTTLRLGLRPAPVETASPLLLLALVILIWALFQIEETRFAPATTLGHAVCYLIFFVFIGAFISAFFFTTLGGRCMSISLLAEGAKVLSAERVGSYDVRVLEADSTEALDTWLRDNGFRALPEAAEDVVSDYLEEGWVFVVSRLRRENNGRGRPHPLSLTFPAQAPVYPMRLTRLAGSDLHLDLYTISDECLSAGDMDTAYCDAFRKHLPRSDYGPEWPSCTGENYGAEVGTPALVELMGKTCVLTHLSANLRNADLDRDIVLDSVPFLPARKKVYLEPGLRAAVFERGLLAFSFFLLLGSFWQFWRAGDAPVRRRVAAAILVGLLLAGGVALHARQSLPRAIRLSEYGPHAAAMNPLHVIAALSEWPELLRKMSREEIEQFFEEALAGTNSPVTGEPFELGEGPGRITIIEYEWGTVVRTYDSWFVYGFSHEPVGMPRDILLVDREGNVPER